MSKKQETIRNEIYNFLKTRGLNPVSLGSDGKAVPVPEEAEVFQFDLVQSGKNYGKVYITIDGLHQLIIYFNDEIANSPKSVVGNGISWEQLVRTLKKFATQRQLSFKLSNQDSLENDMAKREHLRKQEQVHESYHATGKKASYNDAIPSVTLRIQHSRALEENEQRFRHIEKIFVENQLGERFLVPTVKPGLARVYARHIAEGGKANDDRWNHIGSLCEEYNKMAGFVRAVRSNQFNESAQRLVEAGLNHYKDLRESLGKMQGHRGYNAYFESWTPSLMEAEGDENHNLNELFVQETLDPRIESVMPILNRLKVSLGEMKEVTELSEWAESIIEGNEEGVDSPVSSAITRRIIHQRPDLLKFGPQEVMAAIDEVAEFAGDQEEIGSSDVSGWVNQVERILKAKGISEMDKSQKGPPGWNISDDEPGGKDIHLGSESMMKSSDVVKKVLDTLTKSFGDSKPSKKDDVEEGLGYSQDPEQAKWYHEGRKAFKGGTSGNLIQDIAKKHGCPPEWLKAFHAGYQDQEGWGKEDMAEDLDPEQKSAGQFSPKDAYAKPGKLVGATEGFDPLKHIDKDKQTPDIKKAAKDVKRGSYADRAALMKAGGVKDDRGPRGVSMAEGQEDLNIIKRLLGK